MPATLEIDASVIAISCNKLEITDDGFGRGKVLIDGREIPAVVGIEIDIRKGRSTFVRLEYQPSEH